MMKKKDTAADMPEKTEKPEMMSPRTDLALEVRETFEDDDVEIRGVVLERDQNRLKGIEISRVEIKDERGAKAMGKPIGTYITIEAPKLKESDESYQEPIAEEIAKQLKKLCGGLKEKQILIAGLGNREATPDALGPMVVDNLFVTRHLIREFGEEFKKKHRLADVSAVAVGVMGQTGMESVEILKGIIGETKPDLVIVIDALAARSINRLNSTIQLTDTGINPGAGIGNNRHALNKESLGVDVVAIGVPTVVDAATIVQDSMESFLKKQGFSEEENGKFLAEIREKNREESFMNLFVTPKNIDESIKQISYTISEALNDCFA